MVDHETSSAKLVHIDPSLAARLALIEAEYLKVQAIWMIALNPIDESVAPRCRDLSPFGR